VRCRVEPVEALHVDVGISASGLPVVGDTDDARVLQFRRGASFREKSLSGLLTKILRHIGTQHLDRDVDLEGPLVGALDFSTLSENVLCRCSPG